MAKCDSLIVSLFLILNTVSFSWCECIFLRDCPIAQKYVNMRPNTPLTRKLLRNAHCGPRTRSWGQDPKVRCEWFPDFVDLPGGCANSVDCPQEHLNLTRKHYTDNIIFEMNVKTSSRNKSECGVHCGKLPDFVDLSEGCVNSTDCLQIKHLNQTRQNESDVITSMTNKAMSLVNGCGLQLPSGKIFGGQKAELYDFPWLALLKFKNESGDVAYRCHGTLINHRYVISAAHCFIHTSAELRKIGSLHTIVLGEYNIKNETDCLYLFGTGYCSDPLQEFSPESIHTHPKFRSADGINDIALVRLNKNANFSDFVKPICLHLQPLIMQPGKNLLIAGWGKTELSKMSSVKLKGTIQLLPKSNCHLYNIDETQVCAGSSNGTDICIGDSGGPLMAPILDKDRETRTVLAGIVSIGSRCGSDSSVYTNISLFTDWIVKTMHE